MLEKDSSSWVLWKLGGVSKKDFLPAAQRNLETQNHAQKHPTLENLEHIPQLQKNWEQIEVAEINQKR